MKFYNRENELEEIEKILSSDYSEFVYIYGRRRIWKTKLILKSLEKEKFLYFFVWNKTKQELLLNFQKTIEEILWINYIKFNNFREILDFIFNYAKEKKLIVVFDEFQNFFKIEPSIFSDFQYFWDLNNEKMNLKLFCLWSHFTLMKEIFENYSNPLFWRKTASFYLRPFSLITQIEILKDYDLLNSRNLLEFYSIFWWVPKYVEIFLNNFNKETKKDFLSEIIDNFIKDNSFFFFEWKELFLIEFWKSSLTYFSILWAISNWINKKWEIAQITGISVDSLWKYLNKLEKYFELIDRRITVWDKKTSKVSYYHIKDSFLIFWFRYVYKYSNLLEIKKFDKLKEFIKTDINIFLWFTLEELFREILIEINLKENNKILPFEFFEIWNLLTKSNIKIDLVLLNKPDKKVLFIESKLNNKKITPKLLQNLKEKVEKSGKYNNYKKYYWFVSLEKINNIFDEEILLYSVWEFLEKK